MELAHSRLRDESSQFFKCGRGVCCISDNRLLQAQRPRQILWIHAGDEGEERRVLGFVARIQVIVEVPPLVFDPCLLQVFSPASDRHKRYRGIKRRVDLIREAATRHGDVTEKCGAIGGCDSIIDVACKYTIFGGEGNKYLERAASGRHRGTNRLRRTKLPVPFDNGARRGTEVERITRGVGSGVLPKALLQLCPRGTTADEKCFYDLLRVVVRSIHTVPKDSIRLKMACTTSDHLLHTIDLEQSNHPVQQSATAQFTVAEYRFRPHRNLGDAVEFNGKVLGIDVQKTLTGVDRRLIPTMDAYRIVVTLLNGRKLSIRRERPFQGQRHVLKIRKPLSAEVLRPERVRHGKIRMVAQPGVMPVEDIPLSSFRLDDD